MWQIIDCRSRLSKWSVSKLQMAGLLQEPAGPLAPCPRKAPRAESVCGNSGPPREFHDGIISAVQPLLFSRPEMEARPTALSHPPLPAQRCSLLWEGALGGYYELGTAFNITTKVSKLHLLVEPLPAISSSSDIHYCVCKTVSKPMILRCVWKRTAGHLSWMIPSIAYLILLGP